MLMHVQAEAQNLRLKLFRNRVPRQSRRIHAGKAFKFLNAGWASNIDLCHFITDHINPHQYLPTRFEHRSNSITDYHIGIRELSRHSLPAHMHIRPRFTFLRDTVNRAHRRSVNNDDTLVAL